MKACTLEMKEIQVEKDEWEKPEAEQRGIFSECPSISRGAVATLQLYNSKGSDVTSQERHNK